MKLVSIFNALVYNDSKNLSQICVSLTVSDEIALTKVSGYPAE